MYHMIGIKGTRISSLALIMHSLGYEVQGSDNLDYCYTEDGLKDKGIKVLPFNPDNINKNYYIVRSEYIKDDNVEVVRALEMGLKVYSYEEIVGKLSKMFETITVAGCHGKTTTTSLLAHVLTQIKGTNYLIGDGSGYASKENNYFALEACEYHRHFLSYTPAIAIITNIEYNHVDYYKSIDDMIDAYQEYANNATKMVLAYGDDPYTHTLDVKEPIFFYGVDEDNDIIAKDVVYDKDGVSFDVFVETNYYGHFDLPFYGKHMMLNALAVIGVCYYERLEAKEVAKHLKTFKGAKRRFQETVYKNAIVIDDYAHHPTEVKATLKAARQKYPDKKIVAVVKPGNSKKLEHFATSLASALELADYAYIMDSDNEVGSHKLVTDKYKKAKYITIDNYEVLLKHKDAVVIFMSSKKETDVQAAYINKIK